MQFNTAFTGLFLLILLSLFACKSTQTTTKVAGVEQAQVSISDEPLDDSNPYFVNLHLDLQGNEEEAFFYRPEEDQGAVFDAALNYTRIRFEQYEDGQGVTMEFGFEGQEPRLLTFKPGLKGQRMPRILITYQGENYTRLESAAIQITSFEPKENITGTVEARVFIGDTPRLLSGSFSLPLKKK